MRKKLARAVIAAAGVLLVAGMPKAAGAAWQRATSDHFVVYSDDDPERVRAQAEELERFDAMLRRFQNLPPSPDAAFNKVTVYVLRSEDAVERLIGSANIAGFYVPRATGSVAFTPRRGSETGRDALSPRIVLFHEYAHHFLLGNYAFAYPAWFSEGYAEFVSTANIDKDRMVIGYAANHRGYSLFNDEALSINQLFAPPARMTPEQTSVLYARGWLLTHYVEFTPVRSKQFNAYMSLLNGGTPSLDAARQAFGDLKQLDHDLDVYMRGKLSGRSVPLAALVTGPVTVEAMGPGVAAMIPHRIVSTRGVDRKSAGALLAKAAPVAASFPGDPVVQGWFAEMAYDAGSDAVAEAAADRALAADPVSAQASLYKGRVQLRRAAADKGGGAASWVEARRWIVKANRTHGNDAGPLQLFYESFLQQGTPPTRNAVDGLYRAQQLVPQDPGLRFMAARQSLIDGDHAQALALLRPLAFDAHAAPDSLAARLVSLLATTEGQKQALALLGKGSDAAKDPAPAGSTGVPPPLPAPAPKPTSAAPDPAATG